MPCTNCAAFGCECRIPEVRMKKGQRASKKQKTEDGEQAAPGISGGIAAGLKAQAAFARGKLTPNSKVSARSAITEELREAGDGKSGFTRSILSGKDNWKQFLDQNLRQPGKMSYLGSTSHVNLIFDNIPDSEAFYFAAAAAAGASNSRVQQMDREEIEILKIKGAFLLPAQELCDDLVESYFEKIHPLIPIINRTQFMRQYNDPANPPSLLLRQAVLVAGSRVCQNPALMDESGSSKLATATFYKRAKALFDANYETDRIAIVQSTLLMAWFLAGPDYVTDNVYFWTRVSLTIAQSIGLHRSVEKSNVPDIEKRMCKRIWWSLFARDRSTACAMGRPVMINLDDSDVPMIELEDFDESEPDKPSPYPINREHALYFIAHVKLSEIMGLTIREQYSIGAESSRRQNKVPNVNQCDMAMAAWMNNLPPELKYSLKDKRSHDFFKALLHSQYYTVLCLVHRSNILYRRTPNANGSKIPSYPSWGIAFQAAHMIVRIAENLKSFNELPFCPAFMVYSLFSAMIILIYQMESPSKSVVESAKRGVESCHGILEILGQVWDTADQICKMARYLNSDPMLRQKIIFSAKRLAAATSSEEGTENPSAVNSPGPSGVDSGLPTADSSRPGSAPLKRSYEEEYDPNKIPEVTSPNVSYVRGNQPQPQPQAQRPAHIPGMTPLQPNYQATHLGQAVPPNMDFPSELFLVTNTPPNPVFFENFQPSQLFPESVRSNSVGQQSSPEMTSDRGANMLPDALFASHESFGDVFYENFNSPPEDVGTVPNTLNLGDWYKFLMSTSTASHFPDLRNVPVKSDV
ncbi:Asg1p [Sugiyamaella lignohabitans]|uniref:Asg1p n=1 Tax=Sugiyamaella lignohabitans TaxID=796027 RepID=A0A167EWD9_9ASCO|nr:Asg1p [Sugiyamaella lignohabitans]ANB14539.1 Asg1p [Sugiyamaella lignohabitans]